MVQEAKFNGVYCNLTDILIFSPDVHTVDNERFEVEVMMVHKTDQSGNKDAIDGIITCKLLNRYDREHGPEQDFLMNSFSKYQRKHQRTTDYLKQLMYQLDGMLIY